MRQAWKHNPARPGYETRYGRSERKSPRTTARTRRSGAGAAGRAGNRRGSRFDDRRAVLQTGRRKGSRTGHRRLYGPSGQNELAPLDDFGRQNLGALNIEFRAEGDWQAA